MVTLSFDDTEIRVPQSWADIRLGDYERLFRSELNTPMDKVSFVADLCKIDVRILLDNPTKVFDTIVDILKFVFEDYDGETSDRLLIDGTDYLLAVTEELTLAEWVDVESVFESESENRLSDILSVICRPAKEVYDSKKSDERRAMFRDLTMDKALPLLAFFLQRKEKYQSALSHCSQVRDHLDQYLHLIQNFAENGDGTKSLPIWQRIRSYYLTKSLKKKLSKYSDFSFTD